MENQQPRTSSGDGPSQARANYPGEGAGRAQPRVESQQSRYAHDSIQGQVRGLANDITTLFSQEMALARAELREAVAGVKAGMASISVGAGLASSGLLITLLSAVYGLGTVIALWLSALIVGVSALVIGLICLKAGQKKMRPDAFTPERTIESMHRDKETAQERIQ